MVLPKIDEILFPLLKLLEDGNIYSHKKIKDELNRYFQLSSGEIDKIKSSGHETLFSNRIRWSKLYLKRAELLTSTNPGYVKITFSGKKLLGTNQQKITTKFLKTNYPVFQEWFKKT
jgi:restriction system protein